MSDGINPKDAIGATKLPLSLIPPSALTECALAMYEGGLKYGPYNWREINVQGLTYVDAALRHLLKWADGRKRDTSGAHELGHVMACCAILIDAELNGYLADNRSKTGELPAQLEAMRTRMDALYKSLQSEGQLLEQRQAGVDT